MEFVLLKIGSPEWEELWQWLASHPINQGLTEPSVALNENEAWQYTGTYKQGKIGISDLRHRNHPVTNRIEVLSYKHEIKDDSIEKKFRV